MTQPNQTPVCRECSRRNLTCSYLRSIAPSLLRRPKKNPVAFDAESPLAKRQMRQVQAVEAVAVSMLQPSQVIPAGTLSPDWDKGLGFNEMFSNHSFSLDNLSAAFISDTTSLKTTRTPQDIVETFLVLQKRLPIPVIHPATLRQRVNGLIAVPTDDPFFIAILAYVSAAGTLQDGSPLPYRWTPYGSDKDHAKKYVDQALALLSLGTPSIDILEILVILGMCSWLIPEGMQSQAWIVQSSAIRMALVLNLDSDPDDLVEKDSRLQMTWLEKDRRRRLYHNILVFDYADLILNQSSMGLWRRADNVKQFSSHAQWLAVDPVSQELENHAIEGNRQEEVSWVLFQLIQFQARTVAHSLGLSITVGTSKLVSDSQSMDQQRGLLEAEVAAIMALSSPVLKLSNPLPSLSFLTPDVEVFLQDNSLVLPYATFKCRLSRCCGLLTLYSATLAQCHQQKELDSKSPFDWNDWIHMCSPAYKEFAALLTAKVQLVPSTEFQFQSLPSSSSFSTMKGIQFGRICGVCEAVVAHAGGVSLVTAAKRAANFEDWSSILNVLSVLRWMLECVVSSEGTAAAGVYLESFDRVCAAANLSIPALELEEDAWDIGDLIFA
ncbi:hypothetical protein HK100_003568 [Physocladia obscura]|uniref:Transcription factor domain-containing protein n=1 Tax=Physocladia obscura TaxID=109957 RepID=A0AAD5XDH1_9FUNG|nr:hypothetical protein HK100_003568 [Physocladia obscura]